MTKQDVMHVSTYKVRCIGL